jgi:type I restriction enzyme R subunit
VIWHWQGSGKTLTMIFAANKLFHEKILANPSIFFVIDRIELQKQLSDELAALDLGIKPDIIEKREELEKVLMFDGGKGKRGWMVVLIHKFREDELKSLREYLEKELRDKESVLTRENIIVFVDEAHRTQYGILASTMRSILKNAFFFAFTGTPITGKRDTFRAFGNYLDSYFMDDSIEDGYTLEIRYRPSLEKLHVKKELLKEFLKQKEDEIPEEIKGKVNKKLRDIRVYLEDEKIIRKKAIDIADHFKKNLDGKFKAFVVAESRIACIRYKKALDELLPGYSEIVMTFQREDEPEIAEYERELRKRFNGKKTEDILKEIQDNFKNSENPKILIVTNMLLTGFDAPLLQTIYLDKPMKGHTLLQAIARVNRPLKERGKVYGLIIDYIGLFKEINKAITFYEKLKRKKTKIEGISSCESLIKELERKIEEMKKVIGEVNIDFENTELPYQILTKITLEEKEKKFIELYKEIRKLYNSLGFDERRLNFRDYLKFLTIVYALLLRSRGEKESEEVERWFTLIKEEILKDVQIKNFITFPEVRITPEYLKKVEESNTTIDAKVWNQLEVIRNVINEKPKTPVYESLQEEVEKIIQRWKERPKEVKEVYKELKRISNEFIIIDSQKSKFKLNDSEFAVFSTLKKKMKIKNEEWLASKVKEFYNSLNYPIEWKDKKTIKIEIMKKIKLFLIKNFPQLKGEERDEITKEIFQAL